MTCWAVATATAARMSSESVAAHQVSVTCLAGLSPQGQNKQFRCGSITFVRYFFSMQREGDYYSTSRCRCHENVLERVMIRSLGAYPIIAERAPGFVEAGVCALLRKPSEPL